MVLSWLQIGSVHIVAAFPMLSGFGQILPLIDCQNISDIIKVANIEKNAIPAFQLIADSFVMFKGNWLVLILKIFLTSSLDFVAFLMSGNVVLGLCDA